MLNSAVSVIKFLPGKKKAAPAMTSTTKNRTGNTALTSSNADALPALPGGDGAGCVSTRTRVMLEFQRTSLEITSRFLDTQQRVMLAYLAGAPDAVDQRVALMPLLDADPAVSPAAITAALNPAIVRESPVFCNDQQLQPRESDIVIALDSTNRRDSLQHTKGDIEAAPLVSNKPESSQGMISAAELISGLIEIVGERTGYPPEMLDPTLDLEADLGIDSIKRVEILNSFRKLLPADQQTALESGIEDLAGMKTLKQITDWIANDLSASMQASQAISPSMFSSQAAVER